MSKLKEKVLKRKGQTSQNQRPVNFSNTIEISAMDISNAEKVLLKLEHDQIELQDMQKRYPEKRIFCDEEGILRCESRLQNAAFPYDTLYPIFIPSHSNLNLVDLHLSHAHCGKTHLLTLARQRFWMARPSRSVHRVLKDCVTCHELKVYRLAAPNWLHYR